MNIIDRTRQKLKCTSWYIFQLAYAPSEQKAAAAYNLYIVNGYISHEVQRFCERQLNVQGYLF